MVTHESGAAIERFVSELLRWGTRDSIGRAMRAVDSNLSMTDEWLLRRVAEVGPVRLSELAAFQGVDKSTMTAQVRRLENAGLLLRSSDPADRRAVLVRLSAEGRRVHEASLVRARAVLDELVAGWSDEDRTELARLLARLTERIEGTPARRSAD